MTRPALPRLLLVLCVLAAWLSQHPGGAAAQDGGPANPGLTAADIDTSITYQGQLNSGGTPVTGFCDFEIRLFDALTAGAQVGGTANLLGAAVDQGKFTAQLNFGAAAFTGAARYLEVAVRCPTGVGGFTTLSPRQLLRAAPYALSLRPGAVIEGSVASAAALRVANAAPSSNGLMAIAGQPTNMFALTYAGVRGDLYTLPGVYGSSYSNGGVLGTSQTNSGVTGKTNDPSGVGAGVAAIGAAFANSIALKLSFGGVRVVGAGLNTTTPAFIHQVITGGAGNVCGNGAYPSSTVINYPLINGDPGAILVVTPNYGNRTSGVLPVNSPTYVYYDDDDHCGEGAGKWVISNLAGLALPNGARFNVWAVVP